MNTVNKKLLIILTTLIVLGIGVVIASWVFWRRPISESPPQNQPSPPAVVSTASSSIPSQTNGTDSMKIYTNSEFGFEFQYPENWSFHENTFYSPFSKFNLVGTSPEENGLPDPITPSIVVNIVTPDFADGSSTSFKNLNASTSIVIVAGVKVTKYEYEFENLPRIAVASLPLDEYRVLLGASKEYEDILNQVIASFKFLK